MKPKDMKEMVEILSLAIARQEAEEEFFRRSAEASTDGVARNLFTEIADDLKSYRESLEARRRKLIQAQEDLRRATDPVCGMKVDTAKAKHVSTRGGSKYFFCSRDCKEAFEKEPRKYTEP